jgi:hypothetical protein
MKLGDQLADMFTKSLVRYNVLGFEGIVVIVLFLKAYIIICVR